MTLKAFVSSTYEDLSAHRQHVIKALGRAEIAVDPMENWTADADAPKVLSQKRVRGCDLCILLVAFRRGHIPPGGEDKSITQLEYNYAMNNGIDVLVFLAGDDAPWPPRLCDLATDPELRAWRDELRQRHVVGEFDYAPTSVDVLPAVVRWRSAREDLRKTLLPMAGDMELVTQSFYESTFPAYVLDASRRMVSWNTSFMELVGEQGMPLRGQPVGEWLRAGGHEAAVVSTAGQSGSTIERAKLTLDTEGFGRMEFDQLTTPIIDQELGVLRYYTAALSPSGAGRESVGKFLEAVEKRLADQLFWSQYAVAYDRVLTRYSGYRELIRRHVDSVRDAPPGRVLDIGAGTGNVTREILTRCPERRVIAVDYNQSMLYHLLRKCRTFEHRMEIHFAKVEQLVDVTPGSVAAVVMNNVLMFLNEPARALERICSWLAEGGVISLHVARQDASIDTLLKDIERELAVSGDLRELGEDFNVVAEQNRTFFSGKAPHKFHQFSQEGLTELLSEAGFAVERLNGETYAGTGLYALARKVKATARET